MASTPAKEDDRKPAAKESHKQQASSCSHLCPCRSLRSSYADAFLARCHEVDPADFSLPMGTYICPWLPAEPEAEEYFECGNSCFDNPALHTEIFVCRNCGERSEYKDYQHGCRDILLAKMKAALDQAKINPLSIRKQLAEHSRHNEIFENLWESVPRDDEAEEPEKDMKYWASRCRMKTLPLFGTVCLHRPDILCPLKLKEKFGKKKMDFGSHCFQASLIPSKADIFPGFAPSGIQTTWAPRDDSLNPIYSDGGSRERILGVNYTKDAVWAYNQRQTWRPVPQDDDDDSSMEEVKVWRPFTPFFSIPSNGVNPRIQETYSDSLQAHQHGGPHADVWTKDDFDIGPRIKPLLFDLASRTNDSPLPRYQMIIDPNQFVRPRKSDGKKVWVPCEFDISSDGKASLVGNDRAHWMNSSGLIDSIATPVLSAAIPLLAKLKKPYLLLEGQRLQVVVKAQSITVPKKQPNDDAPEYVGLWHVDGEHESVVAVVLYYYDVDDALVGGNMEFLDRRPMAVFGSGDTDMPDDFPAESVRNAFRPKGDEPALISNCSVPVKTGTMIVFSNYQMAHRVLRMVNTSEHRPASRKFVALFVLDPAAEPLVPAKSHLVHQYLYQRALTGKCAALYQLSDQDCLPETVAQLVMEYLGVVPSMMERRATRNEMLRSQLQPKEYLGASSSMVCGTGNGCHTMIGWIDSLLATDRATRKKPSWYSNHFAKPETRINALNFPPTTVGRGLSETLSIPSDDLNQTLFFDTMNERNEQLNADFDKML